MLKQNLDHDLQLSTKFRDLHDHVAIVTGGNSGTGLAIAKQLVRLGSTVVITCRSEVKCQNAVTEIQALFPPKKHLVIPMLLDLNDLASVKSFSKDFLSRYSRLDILVNNAGMVAEPGTVTVQGLEQSFGAMHIGHFALTRYLLKLMLKPVPNSRNLLDAARVVNIASEAFMAGNFHPSFMTGPGSGDLNNEITDNCGKLGPVDCCPLLSCPNTNGYARAKLANIMHAFELQRRVDEHITASSGTTGVAKKFRRLVTASLHPGTVHTHISPFLESNYNALFLRSSDQAAHIILRAILEDTFVPSSYLDGMGLPHDLFNYQEHHLHQHYRAYPEARTLPFQTAKPTDDRLTLQRLVWNSQSLIVAGDNITQANEGSLPVVFGKETVAARLWDISEQIVKDWESNRPILKSDVLTSSGSKLSL